MISSYPTSTSLLQVDRLLTDPRVLGASHVEFELYVF